MIQQIRVRYAPSPTGYLHVGGVRTLLFNYLYAKKHQGKLILRIENTDQVRSSPENEKMMMEDIELLGLLEDEGPTKGGAYGPYRQSDRMKIYIDHARQLLNADKAFHCFCSAEMIATKREAALKLGRTPIYDGTCAKLTREEVQNRFNKGEKAGIRFRAPDKNYVLNDQVRGQVEFKSGSVGDFLITRSPHEGEIEIEAGIGMPTYNFACVIDDYLMKMSHVIRGEDHLSNTARQLMIYDAFGWTPPIFAHTAMVLGSDRQKLSKRNGDTSARDYLAQGYFKEALLNFLAFLGWHPGATLKPVSGHPEILTFEELSAAFDLNGLQKAPAVFDLEKLKWMNTQYMRHLPASTVAERAKPFFETSSMAVHLKSLPTDEFVRMIDLLRKDHALLSDLPEASKIFFEDEPTMDFATLAVLREATAKSVLDHFEIELKKLPLLTVESFDALQKTVGVSANAKGKALFMPIRAATTGRLLGPEVKHVAPILGRDRILKRIQYARLQGGL